MKKELIIIVICVVASFYAGITCGQFQNIKTIDYVYRNFLDACSHDLYQMHENAGLIIRNNQLMEENLSLEIEIARMKIKNGE